MYLSCLNHVNELECFNCKKATIYLHFYIIQKYGSIINIEFSISIMSTQTK